MVKFEKLATDVLRDCYKHMIKRTVPAWRYGTLDKEGGKLHGYILNGVAMYLIGQSLDFIDTTKAFDTSPLDVGLLTNDSESVPASMTSNMRSFNKKTAVCIKANEGDVERWVDVDLLKYFDLDKCSFRVVKSAPTVFVYWGDMLIGLVMSIKLKD